MSKPGGAVEVQDMPCAPGGRCDRHVGVGSSSRAESEEAGAEAARAALDAVDPMDLKLAIVFAGSGHDLARVATGVATVTGSDQVIGCTTAGEIATTGPGDAGVVVFTLSGDGFAVTTGVAEAVTGELRSAAYSATGCFEQADARTHRVVLLLSDGLSGDQQEVVRGAYDRVGAAVPLVGGCAGDDLKMVETRIVHNGQERNNAVVAAAISSDAPMGIGVSHGWRPTGTPMTVTASAGRVVLRIDDEPALDAYLSALGAPTQAWSDPDAFTAFAATRPLGLVRRGRFEIRFVATADFERRTVTCFAEVPQGALCHTMEGDRASVLAAADEACEEALAALGGLPPRGLLVFDCIARKGVLGVGTHDEIDRLRSRVSGAPVAGFYTYGEFARTSGSSGFHNQTLVVLALG